MEKSGGNKKILINKNMKYMDYTIKQKNSNTLLK